MGLLCLPSFLVHLRQAVKTDLESLIEIYFEMRSLCLLSTLLGFALAFQFDSKEKAQGLGLNCGCQCSSPVLTFQDAEGRQQGNCLSADAGGVWCYVDNGATSTCRDLRQSSRFPNNHCHYTFDHTNNNNHNLNYNCNHNYNHNYNNPDTRSVDDPDHHQPPIKLGPGSLGPNGTLSHLHLCHCF